MDLKRLRELGLTDDEVAVLSMVFFDGWGIRRIADRWSVSHTTIQTVKQSGITKLLAAGIVLNKPRRRLPRKRKIETMDPVEMDEKFTTEDRYNART